MLENIKDIQSDDVICFTEEDAIDFIGEEDLTVSEVRNYVADDGELVVVDMDEFYLVVHNFQSEEKYFIYLLIDEGSIEELEQGGFKFFNEDDEFRHKIVNREEGKPHVFHYSEVGAVYGLTREADGDESSFCEYKSASAQYDHILVERNEECARLMHGFEIDESWFEIQLSE
jgi:hypothetical protein